MGSTSSSRSRRLAGAALLVLGAAAAAAAQLYEHPRFHWRIDFPAGWTVGPDAPRRAWARSPEGTALLAVAKARTAAADADAWDRSPDAARRRPSADCRETLRAGVALRGRRGLRVEFECADRASRRTRKGWRTVLVSGGVVNEISFEAEAADFPRWRKDAEAALRSFLPDFGPAGLEERR